MSEIQDIIDKLIEFRDERDWEQFHDSKNLALAISIESAELNELFLWQTDKVNSKILYFECAIQRTLMILKHGI